MICPISLQIYSNLLFYTLNKILFLDCILVMIGFDPLGLMRKVILYIK